MPATPERAAFVAQEFRSSVWDSAGVRELYGRVARDTKDAPFESFFDSPIHAQIMLNERGLLIGGHARRFKLTIDDLLLEDTLDLSQSVPSVRLVDDTLVADLTAAVVSLDEVDFENERTTLSLWGNVGPVPVSIASGALTIAGLCTVGLIVPNISSSALSIAGVGAMSGAGGGVVSASLTVSGVATMAGSGFTIAEGSLTAAGTLEFAAAGSFEATNASSMSMAGVGTVALTGVTIVEASLSIAGAGAMGGEGVTVKLADLTAAGVGAMAGVFSEGDRRITLDGNVRITLGGDTRILED